MAVACGDRVYFVDTTAAQWKETEFTPPKKDGDSDRHAFVALGYTREGRLLGASVKQDPKTRETKITIRDVRTGAVVATQDAWKTQAGVLAELAGAAFSPDATRFAASAADSGIRVGGKGEGVKFEAFQPVVVVWDIASGKQLNTAVGSSSLFGSVAFDPNGRQVGFGKRGLTGELHPGPQGGLVVRAGHSGEVLAVAFDRNNVLWSGGDDKIVLGLDRRTGDERFALRGCPQGVLRLAVSPDGKEVAAACGDIAGGGVVLRFDVDRLVRDVWRAPVTPDRVSLVTALAADGSRFAATDFNIAEGDETSHLTIRDTDGGFERVTKTFGMPLVAAMRPGGLVLLDRGKQLRFTNAAGEPVKDVALPDDLSRFAAPALACAPDGKTVAVVGSIEAKGRPKDGPAPIRVRFQTWDADTGKTGFAGEADLTSAIPPGLTSANALPAAAAFDREGKRLAATFLIAGQEAKRSRMEFRGALVVWDLATGKEVFRQLCDEQLRTVAFDPLGRVVVGGGTASGGAVFAWDMATGKKELTLIGHTRPVLAVAFGPDGRLATGGLDRVVKVWDAASGREVLTLDGFAREVTHVAFTPDAKILVAATGVDLTSTMIAGGLPTDWPAAEVRIFRGPR
jgi:WD40 repeat protein